MNYYERHIGDYLKDTAHLSLLEHGIYSRLLDVYYTKEQPLADAEVARLIGARSKDEREALRAVLAEFFVSDGECWLQRRCEAEIERFKDKQRKAKASADARWAKGEAHTERNANASPDAMRTHSEGNAPRARPQTPDTRHQSPEEQARASGDPQPAAPTPAAAICKAVRKAGLAAVNPGDPRLLALIAQGATEAEFVGIATEAVEKSKGWAWVLHVLQARRTEAAGIALAAPPTDPAAWRNDDRSLRAMAEQLDVPCRPDERIDGWQRRIFTAWQRAGKPPLRAQEQRP